MRGSRICPGQHFAEVGYWTITSSMIAAFDILKALDADGKEIDIPLEFVHGFVRYVSFFLYPAMDFICMLLSHPKPFKCSIKARSPDLARLISHARAELPL